MMKTMRKVLACTLVLTLALGSMSFAMADTYPSLPFRLPAVLVRPTETPEPEVTEAPAETEAPVVTEAPAVTEEPAATEEPRYIFVRDENGSLMLDEEGNPVVIIPEGFERPCTYVRDEQGNLVLDEQGDPIIKDTVPVEAEKILTIDDLLDPNRSIDVYLAMEQDQLFFGGEATIVAVLHGYDNAVYTLQWQTSVDGENWVDVPGATESRMTVIVTEENYLNYWQIQVTITDVLDSASEQE